jgi:hypothetical protein
METAIGWIVVFALALGAHRERAHGRGRAVVGQGGDDGKARAAVGAVGEGIAEAAVARIEDLGETGRAGGQIRHDQRAFLAAGAFADLEAHDAERVQERGFQALDDRNRGPVALEPQQEFAQGRLAPLGLDHDAGRRIADPAVEPQLQG